MTDLERVQSAAMETARFYSEGGGSTERLIAGAFDTFAQEIGYMIEDQKVGTGPDATPA